MLRLMRKVIVPLSKRIWSVHYLRCLASDRTCHEFLGAQPKFVQLVSQLEGRRMSTTITPEKELSYEEFVEVKDKGNDIIIDVRNPEELKEDGKIPGTVNVPLKDLPFALEHLSSEEFEYKYGIPKPKLDTNLVFHCRAGGRSFKALQTALDLGYKNARHYKGGYSDWQEHTGKKSN